MSKNLTLLLIGFLIFASTSINIPLCSGYSVTLGLKDTSYVTDSTTVVNLCHDRKNLYINWECLDQQIISTYTKCNDPLYQQDVVEVFFASEKSYPVNYWEIEVSPKGVLFFSDITNPSGNCSKFSGNPQDCNKIAGSAKILTKTWEAHLTVSLDLIQRNEGGNSFYANIFRIDYTTGKPTRYLAFNPTGTPTPCFHVPGKFEKFTLLNMTGPHIQSQ